MLVKDIMETPAVVVKKDDTVGQALEKMRREKVNGTPVVDDDGKLIGMVVKADIFRFLIAPGHYKSCPVEWVMTKEVLWGNKDDKIVDLAKALRKKDIISIPIVEDQVVQGIISLENIVDLYISEAKED